MQARTITVDGLRVRLLEIRPAEERDVPVLLIHGLGGWAENWAPVMPAIAASGRRAIAVDLPGFGESDRAAKPRYFDVEDPFYGRFFVSLLDTLGLASAHVAGQSFGGSVAFMSAIWAPERVRSLTLVAPGGIGRALPPGFRFLVLPLMERIASWRRSPALTRTILYSCFHDPARCPDEVVAEAVRYDSASAGELIRVLRAGVSFRTGIHESVRRAWLDRSHRYTGPMLVVWGREDRLLPVALAEELRAIAPRAEVKIIPSCGHLVMIERPDELSETFIPFLERAAAPVVGN
jgi:4,5:9,10-diseco-3-hydroxy-5,9,17-trioxoandrosta-1(10),2-diene-4-oate hydrolase